MKLFVDDIRTPPDESWHICRNALSAVRAIASFTLSITDIRLDHDISHQVVMGKMSRPYACDETFEIVARFIVQQKKLTPEWEPKIAIHTSNPIGAARMLAILEDAGLTATYQPEGGANRLEMML